MTHCNHSKGRRASRARGFVALCAGLLAYSVLGAVATIPSTPVHAQSFSGLGFLPGKTYSYSTAVNANGSVAVGTSYSTVSGQAFRWTAAGGMVGLGYLPGDSQSFSAAVNADGSVVVGYSSQNGGGSPQSVRWTNVSGLIGLGYLSGNDSSAATGVSADGSVVVGNTYSQGNCCNNQAFRWTAVGGMVGLGSVSGYPISCVLGVNADGSVVVGVSYAVSLSQDQAFRWTAASGMVELGYLPGGNNSFANAVNADGSVVVGGSTTPSNIHNYEAFRWTQSGGMVGLGYLSGDNFSEGIAVNANGSVVVGCSGLNGNCDQAFLWTAVDGMKSVQALLKAKGVSTTAWTLMSAQGVSADGQVIVGSGVDPNGRTQGWIARLGLPGVPFDAFIATLDIDLHKKPNHDVFRLRSQFILGQNSNGIDPVHEAVTLDVGSFTTTIPPGSFKGKKFGPFEFHGVIDGVGLHVEIKPTGAKRYELEAKARDANLTGTTNPVSVTLTIGDDTGTTSVRADIDHDHDDDDDD